MNETDSTQNITILNELLVDIFNDILTIEQNALREGAFKDLSITEIHTVEAIGMYTARSMSEVASDLKITVGTLTIAINNLVKKDYVERKKIAEDRRVVKIQLTKKGKLAYRIHRQFHSDMIKHTIEGLSVEEEVILMKSLEKLNSYFKSKYNLYNHDKKEKQNG